VEQLQKQIAELQRAESGEQLTIEDEEVEPLTESYAQSPLQAESAEDTNGE